MYLLPNIHPQTVFVSSANSCVEGSNVAAVIMHVFSKVNSERGKKKKAIKVK